MIIAERLVRHRRIILAMLAVVLVLLHIPHLGYPPNGKHRWRESDTAAVIQNYDTEGMNPLEPRINQRGEKSGITGSELPVYEYIAAVGYRMVGGYHAIPRLLSIAMLILAMLWLYALASSTLGKLAGLGAAAALVFAPLTFFYSGKIMPDLTMVAIMMGGVLAHFRYLERKRLWLLVTSGLCLAAAAAIKPLLLSVLLVLLFRTWTQSERKVTSLTVFGIFSVIVAVLAAGWYAHARHVNEINQSIGFDLSPHWDLSWQRVQEIDFYRVLFVRWPLEKWTNYTLLPALAVGLCQVIRDRHKRWTLVWILGVYVAFFLTAISSSTHDYYTLIIVPPMALIVGVGLETLLRQGRKWAPIALVLVLASPVVAQRAAKLRIEPIPEFAAVREDAAKVIPRDALVMVEDNTPPIRLYELDRRGWPMRMGIDSDRVAYCVNRGAEFLVTVRPIDEFESRMRPLFDTTVWRIGPWYAFRVKD